ncbi:MAG: biotin--[acetyl-CoA-carboxylase] ligase [Deltaproteobacteria bacterium]|nr:biotin--[acetyl-CoA-carboxylase] ligase [Candidatus Anaeroferrophillus wilburensis]MBN2888452.1 biotin--[acetyl-CoA-carboxylase] ligase [Deltaproteobacteria bacterium]
MIGCRRIHLPTVDSTNSYAWQQAVQGAEHGLVVVADQQTGGRGRRGRWWISPPDTNLAFSLVLRPPLPADKVPLLSLVAAGGVLSSLQDDVADLWLKWPNDIYCGRQKMAGILAEASIRGSAVDFVVVGIGLNVNCERNDFPEPLQPTVTSMRQAAGRQFSLVSVLENLLRQVDVWYGRYVHGGFSGQLHHYLASHCYLTGKRVAVDVGGAIIEGTAEGIDAQGCLLVTDDHGCCRQVAAGEATIVAMDHMKKGE